MRGILVNALARPVPTRREALLQRLRIATPSVLEFRLLAVRSGQREHRTVVGARYRPAMAFPTGLVPGEVAAGATRAGQRLRDRRSARCERVARWCLATDHERRVEVRDRGSLLRIPREVSASRAAEVSRRRSLAPRTADAAPLAVRLCVRAALRGCSAPASPEATDSGDLSALHPPSAATGAPSATTSSDLHPRPLSQSERPARRTKKCSVRARGGGRATDAASPRGSNMQRACRMPMSPRFS